MIERGVGMFIIELRSIVIGVEGEWLVIIDDLLVMKVFIIRMTWL